MIKLDKIADSLLDELKEDWQIDFKEWDENYCRVTFNKKSAVIFYNPKQFKNASIIHEFLHVWLKKFNYSIGGHLLNRPNPKLCNVFTPFLCESISNFFDHKKMYPRYLELGYSPSDFIMNADEEQCSIEDINNIKLINKYAFYAHSLNLFIGYQLSIYADHQERDYSKHLALLKSKSPELFDIVREFWESCEAFDITKIDAVNYSDLELTDSFYNNMEMWVGDKIII